MKKYINLLIIIAFALSMQAQSNESAIPPEGPTPTINIGEPESFTLDNGIQQARP